MSRLLINTENTASQTVEGLRPGTAYCGKSAGNLPSGSGTEFFASVSCPDLREMYAVQNRTGTACVLSAGSTGRQRNHGDAGRDSKTCKSSS